MRATVLPDSSALEMRLVVKEIAFIDCALRVYVDASALSDLSPPNQFSFVVKTVLQQKLRSIANISFPHVMVLLIKGVGT